MGNIVKIIVLAFVVIAIVSLPALKQRSRIVTATAVKTVLAQAIHTHNDTKLGWMDDVPYTAQDQQRVFRISGQTADSNLSVIRSIQSGVRGSVTRKDFELMRQDRRRAQAAYPDVKPDDLFTAGWVNVDLSAKIPNSFCTSGNSSGTQGSDGKWYLDGGCYISFVRPEYKKRADTATTERYFAALKAKRLAEELDRLKKDGPFAMWSGSGGSMKVELDKKNNEVVVVRAEEWASTGIEYRIPFVAKEWVGVNAWDLDAIKEVPSFAKSTKREIKVRPSGMTITMGSMGSPAGTLQPGESTTITVPLQNP